MTDKDVDAGMRRHDEKSLAEMSYAELKAAMLAARDQMMAADFQERLGDWRSATEMTRARHNEIVKEIDRRIALLLDARDLACG